MGEAEGVRVVTRSRGGFRFAEPSTGSLPIALTVRQQREPGGRFRDGRRLLDVKRGCVEAISQLRQEGAGADLAKVTRRLAETERKLGDSDAAIQRYEEAVALYREVDEPLRLAHTIRHLGDVLYEAGRAEQAESHYGEALAIYRTAQPPPSPGDLANTIRSMAVLKDDAGEIEQAIALWSEARSLYATLNYPLLPVSLLGLLEDFSRAFGHVDSRVAIRADAGEHPHGPLDTIKKWVVPSSD